MNIVEIKYQGYVASATQCVTVFCSNASLYSSQWKRRKNVLFKAFWRLVESESDHEIGDSSLAENDVDCDAEESDEDMLPTPEVVDLALMNANNNNVDAESRFNDFIDGGSDNGERHLGIRRI